MKIGTIIAVTALGAVAGGTGYLIGDRNKKREASKMYYAGQEDMFVNLQVRSEFKGSYENTKKHEDYLRAKYAGKLISDRPQNNNGQDRGQGGRR